MDVTTKTEKQLKKEKLKQDKLDKLNKKKEKLNSIQIEKKDTLVKKVKKECEKMKYDKDTLPGDIKDVSGDMPSSYTPEYVEACWYSWWQKQGFFKPNLNASKSEEARFVMCLPPPNVTGTLHLGHALTISIQDSLARWHRMLGKDVLWIPGSDHAGIATQVVVEKELQQSESLSRHDLGRQAFLQRVWKWKQMKGDVIANQERVMGASLDWSREYFTMDEKMSLAVKEAFIRLHDERIIYRSDRLVNWSCMLNSAISDIEVIKKEVCGSTFLTVPGFSDKVEFGVLVFFAYPILDSEEKIIVATTRIETMLGDSGIAVNPKDERYAHLVGKSAQHPFILDRKLLIVADDYVDPAFGSGAVKLTPCHDINDYELGKRHNLEFIKVFTSDGKVAPGFGNFSGLHRFEARKRVIEALDGLALLVEIKNHDMVVPICSRSKDIVEPMLTPQWYVNCKDMAKQALEAVEDSSLLIHPSSFVKIWNNWLLNIKDWCISRQLWWGHRIPAYKLCLKEEAVVKNGGCDDIGREMWISAHSYEEALSKAVKKYGLLQDKFSLVHDEDVLDTWFSSALIPLSSLGWPNMNSLDLEFYFPGSFLETGHDILFFWVARMVFFSQKFMKQLPFKQIFLHAMVRDSHGRKMSKSLGNIIDPIDVIKGVTVKALNEQVLNSNLDKREKEKALLGQKQDFPNGICECGTDALRFALLAYTSHNRDINLDVNRIIGYRHFCNKIWNASKFIFSKFTSLPEVQLKLAVPTSNSSSLPKSLIKHKGSIHHWILSRVDCTISKCNIGFTHFDFSSITTAIYSFWLYDFCDVYIEVVKAILSRNDTMSKLEHKVILEVLAFSLLTLLRLLHPIMPFLTEELYQRLLSYIRIEDEDKPYPSISLSPYPLYSAFFYDASVESDFAASFDVVRAVRSFKTEFNLSHTTCTFTIACYCPVLAASLSPFISYVSILTNCSDVSLEVKSKEDPSVESSSSALLVVSDKCCVFFPLKYVDVDKEKIRLQEKKAKLLANLDTFLLQSTHSISNRDAKIPSFVLQENERKVSDIKGEIEKISQSLLALSTTQCE